MNAAQSAKRIQSMINEVSRQQGKFYKSVQAACVEIACHAYHHGDWTLANNLVSVFDKGSRKQGLVNWFAKHMGLTWDAKGQAFVAWNGKEHIKEHLEEAKATPWEKMAAPERIMKPYDINEDIRKVIAHFNNAKKRMETLTDEEKAKVNLEMDQALLQNFMSMINFDMVIHEDNSEVNAA